MMVRGSLLLLLVAVAPLGARAEVYIQVEEASMFAAPDASSKRIARGTAGTACTPLEGATAGWVKLRCEKFEGYMKADEVGPEKLDFAALLARAQDPAASASERYDASLKAAWLMPDWDEKILTMLREAFFDAEFESFPRDAVAAVGRLDEDVSCIGEDRMGCVHGLFVERYDWYDARLRGDSAVVVFSAAKTLHVVKLTLGPGVQSPAPPNRLHVRVVSRSHPSAGEALLTALEGKARKKPDSSPSPGPLPLLASLELLDALPRHWLPVRKQDGVWIQDCSRTKFQLLVGAPGDVAIELDTSTPGDRAPMRYHLREVVQAGRTFRFSYVIPDESAPGEAVLTWLPDEPGVGLVNGRAFMPENKLKTSTLARAGDKGLAIRNVEATEDGGGVVAVREDCSRVVLFHFADRNISVDKTSKDKRWATVVWNTEAESQGSLAGSVTMHTALVSVDKRRFLLSEDLGLPPYGYFEGFMDKGGVETLLMMIRGDDVEIPVAKLESLIKPKRKHAR